MATAARIPRPAARSVAPEHTHDFVRTHLYRDEVCCRICHVEIVHALRAQVEALEKRNRELEAGIDKIRNTPPRAAGTCTGGFAEVYRICDNLRPLSQWPASRTDDGEE